MPAENEESDHDAKRKERRAAGVACGAHALARRLHRPDLHHAAALAARLRSRLRGAWNAARALCRHHGGLPDSGELSRGAVRTGRGAGARNGACGPRVLSGRIERRSRTVAGRTVRQRTRRQHPASAGLDADGACVRRSALAAGDRHLQLRRRPGQDDVAGDGFIAAHRDGMATDAGAARCMWPGRGRRHLRPDAALQPDTGAGSGERRTRRRVELVPRRRASRFRCC